MSYRSERTLPDAIASVREWDRVASVVVVDNASDDDSVRVAQGSADLVIANSVNLGFGTAQNLGVAACRSPTVLMLNPDARVDPSGLECGHAMMVGDPTIAMVQGTIVRARDGLEERWWGRPPGVSALLARALRLRERLGEERLRRLARYMGARYYAERGVNGARDAEFLACVAPLVRREAFDEIGGFDERIFLYGEDIDLCLRLRNAGWRLVAVGVPWAAHLGGASSEGAEVTRDVLWWDSHRAVVENHWSGMRRTVGLGVSLYGLRRARRRNGSRQRR